MSIIECEGADPRLDDLVGRVKARGDMMHPALDSGADRVLKDEEHTAGF